MLRGGNEILKTVQEHLGGLHVGDTTTDGKFTVAEVECLGACSNAPMLAVNDDFYVRNTAIMPSYSNFSLQEDLTEETTKKILDAFKNGTKPKPGPQSGRQTSENSAGLTSLTTRVFLSLSTHFEPKFTSSPAIWTRRTLPPRVPIDVHNHI
jgi:NADH dehydrogenase (ubiquinone) flavoprotein 2